MKNTPKVNEVLDDDALLKRYRKEILDLKKQLEEVCNNLTEVNLCSVLIAIGNTVLNPNQLNLEGQENCFKWYR